MSKSVTVSISPMVLQKRLKKALEAGGEPNAELVAEKIIYYLEGTEMGLSGLLMAFLGEQDKTDWVIGDEVMVDPDKIWNWSCDKEKMEAAGMYHKGCIKGKITNINFRKKKPIRFEFEGLEGSNPTPKPVDQDLEIQDIRSDKDLVLVRPNLGSML